MIEFIKANKIGAAIVAVATVAVAALCITGYIKRDTIKGYAHRSTTDTLAAGQEDKGGYAYDTLNNKWVRNDKGGFVQYIGKTEDDD